MAEFNVGDRVSCLTWGNGTVMEVFSDGICNYPVGVIFDRLPGELKAFTHKGTYTKAIIESNQTISKILGTKKMDTQKEDKNIGMSPKEFMEALLAGKTVTDTRKLLRLWKLGKETGTLSTLGGPIWPDNGDFAYLAVKVKTININGYEVPEPVRERLGVGTEYYVAIFPGHQTINSTEWDDDSADEEWLADGLIHLTKEAADLHIEALLSFTKI